MNILAIDLGKFKSVACILDTETNKTRFETIATGRRIVESLLRIAVAKKKGKYQGRKPGTTEAKPARARALRERGLTLPEVAAR